METGKIVIVEDEYIFADSLKMTLEDNGYSVLSIAKSGEDAVQMVEKYNPDLIIMDIGLSGDMDGIEAAGKININYDTSFLYLTAYEDNETFERAKYTEPSGYLIKPVQERDLVKAVEITLYKRRMERERKKLLDEIKVLQGIIPICSHCKKIRDDKGYWEDVAEYISQHSEAEFSHGICPVCLEIHYPGMSDD
ncbi:response regulator [Candidatus Omnitrophota bacterium]